MKKDGANLPAESTILVAEQSDGFRRFPHNLLRKAGFCSLHASHGYEALYLAQLHSSKLRLLIADVDLPFMGGWELAARLEIISPNVKTILLIPGGVSCISGSLACLPETASPDKILSTVRALLAPLRRPAASVRGKADDVPSSRTRPLLVG